MADTTNTLNARLRNPNNCGVYSITSPSGGQYIGSTVSFDKRWREHRRILRLGAHHSAPLQAAAKKYGVDRLAFAVEELCSVDVRLAVEQRYLDALRPRYNTAKDARAPTLGTKRSPETCAKQSAAHLGRKQAPEVVEKRVAARAGYRHSEETKARISAGRLKNKSPVEKIQHTKYTPSEDVRRRTSETMKGLNAGGANPMARSVLCVETGMVFPSGADAVIWLRGQGKLKALSCAISAVCLGKRRHKTAYGYTWRFSDPDLKD